MEADTEVRKLFYKTYYSQITKLAECLEMNQGWKELMSIVPSDLSVPECKIPKYKYDDVRLIEDAAQKQQRCASEIFLDEWATSGKVRPKVDDLYRFLIKAKLHRAADYVSDTWLKEPEEDPFLSDESINSEHVETLDSSRYNRPTDPVNLLDRLPIEGIAVPQLPYERLRDASKNFDSKLILGSGGYGVVYFGKLDKEDVAIKVLKQNREVIAHYTNEINVLSNCEHPKVLRLLGVSHDVKFCMVYQYMPNGSLEDRLLRKNKNAEDLSCEKRVSICCDIAEGLQYLHTAFRTPIIHRDIKSPNILLDAAETAKIGDFGLVRKSSHSRTTNTQVVRGTSVYLPKEAHHGSISPRTDVYSFGVVMLEILTGLPILDDEREGVDLISFIENVVNEDEDILKYLDKIIEWNNDVALSLFRLSNKCRERIKNRPYIGPVYDWLHDIKASISQ